MPRIGPVLAAVILVSGCGGGPPGGHRFRTHTEEGVRVAETTGGPAYAEQLFRFEELFRLEQDSAQEASLLWGVASFERGMDGRYYVVDGRKGRIVVYEADGRYRCTFGRRGYGPGEYRGPEITALDGDTLTIYDHGTQRASRVTTDGCFLDSFRQSNGGVPNVLVSNRDYLIGISWEGQRLTDVHYTRPRALITRATTGDTVAIVRGEFVPESRVTYPSGLGGTYRGRLSVVFFGGSSAMAVTREREIILAQGNQPLIQIFSPLGVLRRIIRIDQQERPIDAAFRNRYFTFMDSLATAEGRLPSEDIRQQVVFAERFGFSTSIYADDRGWFWLRDVEGNVFNWAVDAAWWHVVDSEGRYLGRAHLPGKLFSIRDGQLMSIRTLPETDEQIPIVYRIVPAVEGLHYH